MNFYDIYQQWKEFNFESFLSQITKEEIVLAISSNDLNEHNYLALLSPLAEEYLETMAQKAQVITCLNFGNTIGFYTPLYISDYCVNECVYCGFRNSNKVSRKKLTADEIKREAEAISSLGFKHILLLTGESRGESPLAYIKEAVTICKKYFSSISIEIYPLGEKEYKQLADLGVDGLTIYQEVYDKAVYDAVHKAGPKKDYQFRLEAVSRAALAGFYFLNIGTLLGLSNWRKEIFFTGLHAEFLQATYPGCEISISLPRLKPVNRDFKIPAEITDENMVQIITALRLFLPRVGITLSTRERPYLRDKLISLGITKMSASSTTVVGGRTIQKAGNSSLNQFEISDNRSLEEIKAVIGKKGYQPVMKDWI